MLSKLNAATAGKRKDPDALLCKPSQVHKFPDIQAALMAYLNTGQQLDFVTAVKADGHSGYLRLGKPSVQLFKRQGTSPAMEIPRFERFLTQEALEGLRADLGVEITAWLVRPGQPDIELGHAWVDRAMKAFVQNGYENKGTLHMRLRVFRLVGYLEPSCLRDLKQLVVPGNGVLDVVPFESYSVKRVPQGLRFAQYQAGNTTRFAGHDMEQFIKFTLDQAEKLGIEGKVAYFPPSAMLKPGECVPYKEDSFGTPRVKSWLKIKPEPTANVVAVKVENLEDPDTNEIWLFAKPEDSKMHATRFLRYVGNASDNPILQRFLERKLAPLKDASPEERRALYRPQRLMDVAPGAVIVCVKSASITPRNMLTGVKFYGTTRVDTYDRDRITTDDYGLLDCIESVARKLPHVMSIRAGIEAMQEEGLEAEDVDDALPRPCLKRKAVDELPYSMPWVTRERFPSHERQDSPEPEEEEGQPCSMPWVTHERFPSHERQDAPEPEEEDKDSNELVENTSAQSLEYEENSCNSSRGNSPVIRERSIESLEYD